jgi:DNA-binding MltR family transcriptional regulator
MKPTDLNIDNYINLVREFHSETDRAAAVIAGSFIENFLAKYLLSHMTKEKDCSELFSGFGPFSTYAQRVETAFAFQLIPMVMYSDLKKIGSIRNLFAHSPIETSFSTDEICSWCSQLSTKHFYPVAGSEKNKNMDNRNRYLLAISTVIGKMHNKMLEENKNT